MLVIGLLLGLLLGLILGFFFGFYLAIVGMREKARKAKMSGIVELNGEFYKIDRKVKNDE